MWKRVSIFHVIRSRIRYWKLLGRNQWNNPLMSSKAISTWFWWWCVQPEPEFRPPMSEVVQALVRLMQRASLSKRRSESAVGMEVNEPADLLWDLQIEVSLQLLFIKQVTRQFYQTGVHLDYHWENKEGLSVLEATTSVNFVAIGAQRFRSSSRMSSCVTTTISVLTWTCQPGDEAYYCLRIILFGRLGRGSLVLLL